MSHTPSTSAEQTVRLQTFTNCAFVKLEVLYNVLIVEKYYVLHVFMLNTILIYVIPPKMTPKANKKYLK